MATIIRKTSPELYALATHQNALLSYMGAGTKIHIDASEMTVTAAAATDLATSLTLANQIKRVYNGSSSSSIVGYWVGHRLDTMGHLAVDSTNSVTAADATSLATCITLANQLKAKYNAHRTQAGVHHNNDAVNVVTVADAVNLQAEVNALLNDIKAQVNAHMADAPSEVGMLRIVDA